MASEQSVSRMKRVSKTGEVRSANAPGKQRRLPIRKRTNAIERRGVAHVRTVVEDANCVFKEIDRASDYGHDAFVLLVDDEEVTPMEIALQIKAGRSFCRAQTCKFSATRAQLTFWARHPFTTLGVVYDPDAECAWWVDLREEARSHSSGTAGTTVTFSKQDWNRFDGHGFEKVLLPTLLGEPPRINLETALAWAVDTDSGTHDLGTRVLLARFRRETETWEAIFREFRRRGSNASFSVYRGLVRIMGHADEGYFSDEVPWSIRSPRQTEVMSFGKAEVVALLHFVDDRGFERGSSGYGLFAIIPSLIDGLKILCEIANDGDISDEISNHAALLLAIHADDPQWWSLWLRKPPVSADPRQL